MANQGNQGPEIERGNAGPGFSDVEGYLSPSTKARLLGLNDSIFKQATEFTNEASDPDYLGEEGFDPIDKG